MMATDELALAGTVKRRVLCDELWRWEPCGFGLSAVGVVAGGEVVPWPAIEEARSWRAAGAGCEPGPCGFDVDRVGGESASFIAEIFPQT